MQAGRSGENSNPFATVDWLAYQGAPPKGMTGTVKMQKWWSGTKCEDVTFPKVGENQLHNCLFSQRMPLFYSFVLSDLALLVDVGLKIHSVVIQTLLLFIIMQIMLASFK